MNISFKKKLALILMVLLFVPVTWTGYIPASAAATPTFVKSKIELIGSGKTYQLEIKDKVAKSTYKWSSSNTKIAKVSSKGVVTAAGPGTATIKCKITYPSKKTKTITSKITVTIPAEVITINNENLVNGAHKLIVGEQFDFNCDILPTNSSYKAYWYVDGGDADCIRIDDVAAGKVTALKAGKVVLKAAAVKNLTAAEAKGSIINDAVIVEVVAPKAEVRSADITGSNEIKVVFDSPVDKTTIIDSNNKLLDSIGISMIKNAKGVMPSDPGTLTASLSSDNLTLTITASGNFDGAYGISFSNKIKTITGLAIDEYYKQITYVDTVPPTITDVSLDDTGMVETITFSEAIDFAGLKISNVMLMPTSNATKAEQSTLSIIGNRVNYIPSADKKSLVINMTHIASTDFGKKFTISISGIKDMSGNVPSTYALTTLVYTDTTPRPQALPLYVRRTSYNTLTATFSRGIDTPGYATLDNGSFMYGTVDINNNRLVNYTLNSNDVLLTGSQKVTLSSWNSFNVVPTDTSALQPRPFSVDFTVDKSNPVLLTYEYDAETSLLTLTYNKDVTLAANTGVFLSRMVSVTAEIIPDINITYTKVESTDSKVIKLQIGNMTTIGDYYFTLDPGFAKDSFNNSSLSRDLQISNGSGKDVELPAPYSVSQSMTNLSQINIDFADRIDVASASKVTNYQIPGVTIKAAVVTKNTDTTGATVTLTVADGAITISEDWPITISGIMGYNGSYGEMSTFSTMVPLKDNKRPNYISTVFDRNLKNVIHVNFSEEITGTLVVRVTQIVSGSSYPLEYGSTVSVQGSSVNIMLDSIPVNNGLLKIDILSNSIADLSGNQVIPMQSQLAVPAQY